MSSDIFKRCGPFCQEKSHQFECVLRYTRKLEHFQGKNCIGSQVWEKEHKGEEENDKGGKMSSLSLCYQGPGQ